MLFEPRHDLDHGQPACSSNLWACRIYENNQISLLPTERSNKTYKDRIKITPRQRFVDLGHDRVKLVWITPYSDNIGPSGMVQQGQQTSVPCPVMTLKLSIATPITEYFQLGRIKSKAFETMSSIAYPVWRSIMGRASKWNFWMSSPAQKRIWGSIYNVLRSVAPSNAIENAQQWVRILHSICRLDANITRRNDENLRRLQPE